MPVFLRVLHGKPRGAYLRFGHGEYLIGRSAECHIRPNSHQVSRRHCTLHIDGQHVRVRDLGSANGVLVNGTRLEEERALIDGDRLQIGPVVFSLHATDELMSPLDRREVVVGNGRICENYIEGVGWVLDSEATHCDVPLLRSSEQGGIINCPGCDRSLLAPFDTGMLRVRCPKCARIWLLASMGPGSSGANYKMNDLSAQLPDIPRQGWEAGRYCILTAKRAKPFGLYWNSDPSEDGDLISRRDFATLRAAQEYAEMLETGQAITPTLRWRELPLPTSNTQPRATDWPPVD
jgi:pSer/pThr/pTyr-binding forkhead associated (FHA) protein